MHIQKFRWSRVYESSEEELVSLLKVRNIPSTRVHAEAGDTAATQHSDNSFTLWCAEGSLLFETESAKISLQPGDAARIGADTTYTIHPGIADCVYYLTS